MTFKVNIAGKDGKTFHLESESESLVGKSLHDKINGGGISENLKGYEFEITGASDSAGFPSLENVEGIGLKKVLLTYGKGMHKAPKKEGKKKRSNPKPKGLRLRKTVRGKTISQKITQINLKIIKQGEKKLSEIFPEQNKKQEQEKQQPAEQKPVEEKKEEVQSQEKPVEEKQEEKIEESKPERKPYNKEEKS